MPGKKREIFRAFWAKVVPLTAQPGPPADSSARSGSRHPTAQVAQPASPDISTPASLPSNLPPTSVPPAFHVLPNHSTSSIRPEHSHRMRRAASWLGLHAFSSHPQPRQPASPVQQQAVNDASCVDLTEDPPIEPFTYRDGYNDGSEPQGLGLRLGIKRMASRLTLRSMDTKLRNIFPSSQGPNQSEADLGMKEPSHVRPAVKSLRLRVPSLVDGTSFNGHPDPRRLSRSTSFPALPKTPSLVTNFPVPPRPPILTVATNINRVTRPEPARSRSLLQSSTKSSDSPRSVFSDISSFQSPASTTASSLPTTSPIAERDAGGQRDVLGNMEDFTNNVVKVYPVVCMRGGYSDVFKGINLATGEFVAIKRFRAIRVNCDFNSLECFQRLEKRQKREAVVLGSVKNPRVTPLLGHAVVDQLPAIIMPWYENGHATNYLTKHEYADRRKIVFQVAEGLACLHSSLPPIVHADVKPFNVLIDNDGDAALSDFGLAKALDGCSTGFTTSNDPCYSIRYASPETLEEHPKSIEGDVYSFACLALEVLTDIPPFPQYRNSTALIMAKNRGEIPLRVHSPLISDSLWGLLVRCWQKDHQKRPTMDNVVQAMRSLGWDQDI